MVAVGASAGGGGGAVEGGAAVRRIVVDIAVSRDSADAGRDRLWSAWAVPALENAVVAAAVAKLGTIRMAAWGGVGGTAKGLGRVAVGATVVMLGPWARIDGTRAALGRVPGVQGRSGGSSPSVEAPSSRPIPSSVGTDAWEFEGARGDPDTRAELGRALATADVGRDVKLDLNAVGARMAAGGGGELDTVTAVGVKADADAGGADGGGGLAGGGAIMVEEGGTEGGGREKVGGTCK